MRNARRSLDWAWWHIFVHGVRRMLLLGQWGDVSRIEFMPAVSVIFQLIFSGVKLVAKLSLGVPWRLTGEQKYCSNHS